MLKNSILQVNGAEKAFLRLMIFSCLALMLGTFVFAESAADTYKSKCSPCHGKRGDADTLIGKNLKLRPFHSSDVQNQTDEQLFTVISRGKDKMPAFYNKLPKEQIHQLVEYVRTLKR